MQSSSPYPVLYPLLVELEKLGMDVVSIDSHSPDNVSDFVWLTARPQQTDSISFGVGLKPNLPIWDLFVFTADPNGNVEEICLKSFTGDNSSVVVIAEWAEESILNLIRNHPGITSNHNNQPLTIFDTSECQLKLKYLRRIRTAIAYERHGSSKGPRSQKCMREFFFISMLLLCVVWLLDFKNLLLIILLVPAVVFLFVFYRYKKSNLPLTWAEHIDELLINYQPVDVEGFKTLQRNVTHDDIFNFDVVRFWVSKEIQAIEAVMKGKKSIPNAGKIANPKFTKRSFD